MIPRILPAPQWAAQQAADLPARWRRRILARWNAEAGRGEDFIGQVQAERTANIALRETVASLQSALSADLPLDATDADICDRAERLAADLFSLATLPKWTGRLLDAKSLRLAMEQRVDRLGATPPPERHDDGPAIARMTCPQWWRRQLRKLHAKAVEGAAIRMGYVHRNADPYVSNESLQRRLQQNARNAAALEATVARNEAGQEYTLAELAATGPANKAIRRAELMTRIAGFERIAVDCGHAGLFLTITCPSRMHRWRTVAGGRKTIENPRYDGTNPRLANEYLGTVWARIRAALARGGVRLYGFRIAEPQHDGTPHWHFLVFHEPAHADAIRITVRRYALADSPDEPGAQKHRCDFKPIDRSRGSAAGYIAKYVAKNIDGYKVETDLLGNDAMETSARVEAWATTWRIRQFQQVGGPPVGVWRELRRVATLPEGCPEHLQAAHRAVNKLAVFEGRANASVAWDHYTRAQGGVFCGRKALITLAKREGEGTGRYGDAAAPRVFGVQTVSREVYVPDWNPTTQAMRLVHWVVESARHAWEIVGRKTGAVKTAIASLLDQFGPDARGKAGTASTVASELSKARTQETAEAASAWRFVAHPRFFAERAQPAQPWTCVNNCTEGAYVPDAKQADGGPSRLHELQSPDPRPDGARRGPPAGGGHRAGHDAGGAGAGAGAAAA